MDGRICMKGYRRWGLMYKNGVEFEGFEFVFEEREVGVLDYFCFY